MQSNDATEPVQWKLQELRQSLDEWAGISRQMIDLLHETAGADSSRNWRPHVGQIVSAIGAFGDRCRTEASELGARRADELAPEDAFERVRAQGQRLVEWLQRMIPE